MIKLRSEKLVDKNNLLQIKIEFVDKMTV